MIIEAAPAKLNLALHVTGRRPDGYHLLDSLVCFAAVGDSIALTPGPLSLSIDGPFAAGLSTDDNLCLRAARLVGGQAAIRLTKAQHGFLRDRVGRSLAACRGGCQFGRHRPPAVARKGRSRALRGAGVGKDAEAGGPRS